MDFGQCPISPRLILNGVAPRGFKWSSHILDWIQARLNYQKRGEIRVTRADGALPGWDGMGVTSLPIPAVVEFR